MKNLTRIIVFAVVLLSLTVSTVFASDSDLGLEEEFSSPAEMFEAYYNDGVYTRISNIYLDENNVGVQNAFHGPVITEKTTWFDSFKLVMDTNSGYEGETSIELPTKHFYYDDEIECCDYSITEGSVRFYTLAYFTYECPDVWEEQYNGDDIFWVCEKDESNPETLQVIEAALGFAAPCFTNISKTTGEKYLELSKVSVHNSGDTLIFQLFAKGRIEAIAQTKIVKGVDGMQAFIGTATKD